MKEQKILAYCGIDCAVCPEYSCARLDACCTLMPTARMRLEGLRKGG